MTSHDTGTDKLLVEVTGSVATLTFNNPAKRNALSSDIRAALPGTLKALNADDDVRVIVVTGAGGKAFVSGADISEFGDQRTSPEARASYDAEQNAIRDAWAAIAKPVIAMIRGFCIGGGLITAMAADIRIASSDSQFGIPAARLGLGYGPSGVSALMALVGPACASEILFSARRFSADEAAGMGLVNRVVPADDLRSVVFQLAETIAANAPLTIAAAKAGIRAAQQPAGERDLTAVNQMVEACFRSQDYQEGQRAFAEKRRPKFTGQ
ncbi:MAG: enoyl-CoA hydratase [Streptosporangiales bacterium]|nr:enoyl-CoA hydratase [Streptosporangiales bacterium]